LRASSARKSWVFRGALQLELYEEISEHLDVALSAINLIGSGHTDFSLIKGTDFSKENSDLDVAIVDSRLFLELFEQSFETTNGWNHTNLFPGDKPVKQQENRRQFLRYIGKGIIRPDLMPNSPERASWTNFFGKLAWKYQDFCNGISAGIYASETFMAAKQERAIEHYLATKGKV